MHCCSTPPRRSSGPRTESSSSCARPRSLTAAETMSRRAWLAFAALSLIWGVPYLFIKIAVDGGISPFFLAWARLVLGAALLFALAPRQGARAAAAGPPALDPRLRHGGDGAAVPADRRGRAARRLLGRRHRDRDRPAADRAARAPLRSHRAPDAHAHDRDADRARRSGRAGRDRPERRMATSCSGPRP